MLLDKKKVAVIGAGPVGLMMARLLQQRGIAVTVYERDPNPRARIWGGTLDLHEGSGQAAARAAGLLAGYFAKAKPMGRKLADEQGHVFLIREPTADSPEINRNDLRTLLLDSLTDGTVVWGRKFSTLTVRDGQWQMQFEQAPDEAADLVIGANGGLSSVRPYVTDAEAEDTGSYIIQGEVVRPETECPAFFRLCQGNIFMTAGEGQTLVVNPDNAGAMTYNVSFTSPGGWSPDSPLDVHDPARVRTFLNERFSGWSELYQQLVQSTSSFWGLPTRKLPLDQPWKRSRPLPVTLIGDAAHLMPPFAGQGVNTGLRDALVLVTCLTEGPFTSLNEAIAEYERQMLIYAREAQAETSRNEQEMHQPDFSFRKRFSQ